MDKNQKFVITINRELGSGGRTVGEKLAEKLGYDTRNYDLVITADGKTEDQIVDQILLYIEQ